MDLNPFGYSVTFDLDFQVWRPSPTVGETGCYSLVNNFAINETSLPSGPEIDHVARVTPPPQNQLQFQPEDVLGFYVESHGTGDVLNDNGVVLLSHANYSSELVWFASVDITATQPSQSGSCPYPVGTSGILSSSTRAAPVISISVTTYPCPPSLSIIIDPRPVPTVVPNSATIDNYSPSSATEFTTHSNENSNRDLSIRLVVGISVSTALVMVALATTTAVIVIVLYHCKIRRQYRRATVSVTANSNGGRSVGEQLDTLMPEVIYDYPEVNPTTLVVLRLTQKVIESHFPLIFKEMKLTWR